MIITFDQKVTYIIQKYDKELSKMLSLIYIYQIREVLEWDVSS